MSNEPYLWDQTVDHRQFRCTVEQSREDAYHGILRVVTIEGGDLLMEVPVSIMYGAPFGADVDDIFTWQDMCIEVIDEYLAARAATKQASKED